MKRRDFMRSAGLVTLFAPFIELLQPKQVKAAATGGYENLLVFFTNGTDIGLYSPRGSNDTSITFSKMTEPLEPLKSNLILVEKLNGNGTTASHGAPGGLCGMGYGQPTQTSIDQWISDRLPSSPIKNLVLGSVSTETQCTFYREGKVLTPIYSVTAAHQAIFSGFTAPTTVDPPPMTGPDPKAVRRQSSLSLIKDELAQLKASLGAEEKEKIELHEESIRQLEASLESSSSGGPPPTSGCVVPPAPTNGTEALANSAKHLELAVAAFACGRTRVASVQFGHHQNTQITLPEIGTGDWHNSFMHGEMAPRTHLVNTERWLCEQFVAAAEKLKAIPLADGSGTLFDKTLLFWARDMGDGILHTGDDMRFVFAGGGSALKLSPNGRYLDGKGAPHQNALVAAAELMGVTDYQGWGDMSQPRTPLTGLTA